MSVVKTLLSTFCFSVFLASSCLAQGNEQDSRWYASGTASGDLKKKPPMKKLPPERLKKKGLPRMKGTPKKKARRAFVAGDYIFLKMPGAVEKALRWPLSDEKAPRITATINGIKVTRLQGQIKTGANVVTTVSPKGETNEGMLGKKEAAMLLGLGAESSPQGVSARGYLKLPVDPFDKKKGLSIQVLWPKKSTYSFYMSKLKKKKKGPKRKKGKLKKKGGKNKTLMDY
jgi:hypothetical protein